MDSVCNHRCTHIHSHYDAGRAPSEGAKFAGSVVGVVTGFKVGTATAGVVAFSGMFFCAPTLLFPPAAAVCYAGLLPLTFYSAALVGVVTGSIAARVTEQFVTALEK